jgi:ABC-2 type transport system permease protein
MPTYVQRIGDFVPTTWFLKAGETVLDGKGLMGASHELLYLFTFAAIILVLSFSIKTEKLR